MRWHGVHPFSPFLRTLSHTYNDTVDRPVDPCTLLVVWRCFPSTSISIEQVTLSMTTRMHLTETVVLLLDLESCQVRKEAAFLGGFCYYSLSRPCVRRMAHCPARISLYCHAGARFSHEAPSFPSSCTLQEIRTQNEILATIFASLKGPELAYDYCRLFN